MEGRTIIQWSKEDIEALGFFKIDILALGMLTAIRKAFTLISTHHGEQLSMDSLPESDEPTWQMIQRAETVGTFQIESRAQMSMLPRLRPRCFYDLVVQVGIIRPGPIQGGLIHPFLKRRDGLEPVVYAHPKLEPVLRRTMGVPIFQEQVMRIAMAVGGFTGGEADALRKQIGAWSIKKDLGPVVEKMAVGMRRHGISEYFIKQILGHLKGFANYGFPESHAISFAHIAWASAWIKCHYPAAFFAAVLNSQPMGFYSRHALIQTARREGVTVRPVCVNHSDWDATLETGDQGVALRLGLHLIKGMSEAGARSLVATRRQKGPWNSTTAFLQDSPLHRGDLTAFTAADGLHSLGIDRRAAIWMAEAAPFAPRLEDPDLHHDFAPEDEMTALERDYDAFGTSLRRHPVALFKESHWHWGYPVEKIQPANKLSSLVRNHVIGVFGMVLVRQAPGTAKGMVFFTLEDETGFINLVFTPQVYERFRRVINHQGFLCVEGRLQSVNEGHSVMVKRVFPPRLNRADVIDVPFPQKRAVGPGSLPKARNYM